jgi:hypothetical protein
MNAIKRVHLLGLVLLLGACTPEVGSEKWCKVLEDKPKTDWSFDEGVAYTKYCIVSQLSIGSETWCEKVDEKPKGDWTGDEAKNYARYCVVRLPEGDK